MSFDQAIHAMLAAFASLAERLGSGTSYNPLSAGTVQDPYPAYAALRSRSPVHRSRVMNAWLFTRHADVDTILRDHRRFGNDPCKGTLSSQQSARLPPPDEFTMLLLDPPDHTRLRSLVNKAFTSRAVNALEPRIRSVLNTLLDEIDDLDGFDLIEGIARPLALGAANRNPEAFDQPDRLDVGRGTRSHVSFGRGIHHCLGATLARLEGRIVLEMLPRALCANGIADRSAEISPQRRAARAEYASGTLRQGVRTRLETVRPRHGGRGRICSKSAATGERSLRRTRNPGSSVRASRREHID